MAILLPQRVAATLTHGAHVFTHRSVARANRAQPGGVDGGETGDTIDSAADGDLMDWTRARGPVGARGDTRAVRADQASAFPAAEACGSLCMPKAAPATAGSTARAKDLDQVASRTGRPRLGARVPAP